MAVNGNVVWQYASRYDGYWKDMSFQTTCTYERGLANGDSECKLNTSFKGPKIQEYILDYKQMVQKNVQKGSQRQVRRLILANPTVTPNNAGWSICDTVMTDSSR